MPFRFTDPARYRYRKGCFFLGLDDDGNETGVMLERHAVMIGGARSGKGAAVLIPNARRWHGTVLGIDPKGENVEKTYRDRQAMGQAVYALDPYHAANIPPELRAAFNPLAAVDPTSRSARSQVQAIGNGLIAAYDEKHGEWTNTAREILAGICGYVIAAYAPEHRTFRTVRALLNQPDQLTDANGEPILDANGEPQGLYITAQRMLDCIAFGGIVRSAANQIMRGITSEKSVEKDAISQAQRHTSWLDDEPIAETLDRSTFSLSDLKTGKASVFLVIPPEHLKTSSAYLRLFVQCAIAAMAAGGQKGSPCLFLLDEFFALGKLDDVETAIGLLPSYGVHLVPFLQNLGQLYKLYGSEGATTFLTNADASIFFGNAGDQMALEYVSRRIGPLTPDEITESPPEPEPFVPLPQPFPVPFRPKSQPQTTSWGSSPEASGFVRADETNAMREWQDENTAAEAAHRAREEAKMREWATANAKAQEEHNARQRARQAVYDHHMRQVNQPRLTPSEIEKLTGKPDGAQVASSMIVFAKAGDVLNLQLAPYFRTFIPPASRSTTARAEATAAPVSDAPVSDARYNWARGLPVAWVSDSGTRWFDLPDQPREMPDQMPPLVAKLANAAPFWSVYGRSVLYTEGNYETGTPTQYDLQDGRGGWRMEWDHESELKPPRFSIWWRPQVEWHRDNLAAMIAEAQKTITRQKWRLVLADRELIGDLERHIEIWKFHGEKVDKILRLLKGREYMIRKADKWKNSIDLPEVDADFVLKYSQQKSQETA